MKKEKRFSIISYSSVLFLVIVLALFIQFSDSFSKTSLQQEKQLLENAIQKDITQCYALEGTYPVKLSYLQEYYGLSYNEEHFFVDYQYIGSNLRPTITIIER